MLICFHQLSICELRFRQLIETANYLTFGLTGTEIQLCMVSNHTWRHSKCILYYIKKMLASVSTQPSIVSAMFPYYCNKTKCVESYVTNIFHDEWEMSAINRWKLFTCLQFIHLEKLFLSNNVTRSLILSGVFLWWSVMKLLSLWRQTEWGGQYKNLQITWKKVYYFSTLSYNECYKLPWIVRQSLSLSFMFLMMMNGDEKKHNDECSSWPLYR